MHHHPAVYIFNQLKYGAIIGGVLFLLFNPMTWFVGYGVATYICDCDILDALSSLSSPKQPVVSQPAVQPKPASQLQPLNPAAKSIAKPVQTQTIHPSTDCLFWEDTMQTLSSPSARYLLRSRCYKPDI